jgi:Rrf2 family protein
MLYVADKVEQKLFDYISTQQISKDLNIPASTARMILGRLSRAGLIETKEGAGGGIRLAVAAKEITILDIFEAIEHGKTLFNLKQSLNVKGAKPTRVQHSIADILTNAETAMQDSLASVTVLDLMRTINE